MRVFFIKSLDPDGTRHGVFGAEEFGYFESTPNHDAICFRVVDEVRAERIYNKMASIKGLRPHDLIIAYFPGLDDMYESPDSWLCSFGTWVNGGHWTTCEARMIMSYYRLGRFEDAMKSMKQIIHFARDFRMDNPLVEFGSKPYQPNEPVNLCYDSFGAPAAMIRGLFEYLYDDAKWDAGDFGDKERVIPPEGVGDNTSAHVKDLSERIKKIQTLQANLKKAGLENSYEMKHAELVMDFIHATFKRQELLAKKEIPLLPESSQKAADDSYLKTADNLYGGLVSILENYSQSTNADRKKMYEIWKNVFPNE
jgi:hypothetical protein